MAKKVAAGLLAVAVVASLIVVADKIQRDQRQSANRAALLEELQPVKLAGCELARFGGAYDGGYLLCGNLLGETAVAYSYGIDGRDSWGCSVSRRHGVTVHQYDCFNTNEPLCNGGAFAFHPECVGNRNETIDGREFDTLASQIARNGDDGKRLVVKMDIEGAEWRTLLAAPDSLLDDVDQLVVEFHGVDRRRHLKVVRRLKERFYVGNLHFNNHTCTAGLEPFPAWAYEVLFVNKRIAELDESGATPALPNPLDQPNTSQLPDCQTLD
jgi:hypothetical protein